MATFVFDAWKDKTPEQLKDDCLRLSRALYQWQLIAVGLFLGEDLSPEQKQKVQRLIDAYADDVW